MKKYILLFLIPFISQAQYVNEEDDFISYESIVNQLKSKEKAPRKYTKDPMSQVKIHLGVGYVTSLTRVRNVNGQDYRPNLNGFQTSFGIDLLSKYWIAEGTYRSFNETETDQSRFQLQEFDLKLIHRDYLTDGLSYRMGGGIAARYLQSKILNVDTNEITETNQNTPAFVGQAGLHYAFSKTISLGAELAFRDSIISESIDQRAFDMTIRLDGQF